MSVYALTSINGSPGVTTTAIAWAYLASTPTLVVEADPLGGSAILAGVMRGEHAHDVSIIDLVGQPVDGYAYYAHERSLLLPSTTDRRVLPGIAAPEQAKALASTWGPLGASLQQLSRETGSTVLIDCGRFGHPHTPYPLIERADAVLVFTHASLPGINAAHLGLENLRKVVGSSGTQRRMGVVTLGGGKDALRPYSTREVAHATAPTEVIASLDYEPRRAAVYSGGVHPTRGHDFSGYVRSVKALISAGDRLVGTAHEITGGAA